nr:MAG TPA: hypothetical protein [Caudoviricetes sp.]
MEYVSHVYSANHNAWRKEQPFILKIRGCFYLQNY